MSRNLRDRPTKPSQKAEENKDIAEDEAYLKFQNLAVKVGKATQEYGDIDGACSDVALDKKVSELETLKKKLDKAYTNVKKTARSNISSRIVRKNTELKTNLSQMQSHLRRMNDGSIKMKKDDHSYTRKLSKYSKASVGSVKSLPATLTADLTFGYKEPANKPASLQKSISFLKKTELRKSSVKHTSQKPTFTPAAITDATDIRDRPTEYNDDATDSDDDVSLPTSYPSSCTHSNDTVEDYLKNKCDYDALFDEYTAQPQMNMVELAKLMSESINASRLPIPEPTVFTGNPLEYPSWKCSFETLIESKSIHPNHRIHYLKKYIGGDAKAAVECTFYVNQDQDTAFNEAKETLEKRYGNPFLISEAIRDKLYKWPKIGSKDSQGLRMFADYLQQCNMAMKTVDGLSILNDCRENQKLLQKLPEGLVQRWSRVVARDFAAYPSFSRFALFITKEADIVCNPILSTLRSPDDNSMKQDIKPSECRTFATDSPTTVETCEFCQQVNHTLPNCKMFTGKTYEDRREFIISKGICFSCLKRGHTSRFCPCRLSCEKCEKRHPTCLCGDLEKWKKTTAGKETIKKETKPDVRIADGSTCTVIHNTEPDLTTMIVPIQEISKNETKPDLRIADGSTCTVVHNREPDLTTMIVPIQVYSNNSSKSVTIYALQDSQSDTTFILDSVADQLDLKSEQTQLRLSTMTDTSTIATRKVNNLMIRGIDCEKMITVPTAYTRNFIPVRRSHIPTTKTAEKWPHLHNLKTKISKLHDFDIGMLIGYNCADAIKPRSVISGAAHEPYGIETHIGWSIVGATHVDHDCLEKITMTVPDNITLQTSHTNKVHYAMRTSCKEIISILESDFVEREFDSQVVSQEDMKFMRILKKETRVDADGFYELPLPFKTECPSLPDNRWMAEKRLEQLKRRLTKNSTLYEDYTSSIDMMLEKKYAEEVPPEEESPVRWYIPHHAVYNTKKSSKARVVFDCSARCLDKSLNDCLLQGPDLLNSLILVLCKFREDAVAFMGDIEKMFYRFKVRREHRDYLRFLWWKDGNMTTQPIAYRMTVHIFGATSSPGCANFALKKLANDYRGAYSDETIEFLLHSFYVDDGLYSTPTVDGALKVVDESRQLCADGQLRLHKFMSNSRELLDHIPESERAVSMSSIDLAFDELPTERALGIIWNAESDVLQFIVNPPAISHTPDRRSVLSIIASLYDPLGCVAPFVLSGKLILQSMCREEVRWDEPMPTHLIPRWKNWLDNLAVLDTVAIPRCYVGLDFGKSSETRITSLL